MRKNILLKPAGQITHDWPLNLDSNDILDFRDERTYLTHNVFLKLYGKVWVSPDSVIYKNGIVINETLATSAHKKYYQTRHLVKKILTGKKVNLGSNKKYLLVTDSWSAGHFHWFCDVLPRLFTLYGQTSDFILLLPDTSYTRTIAVESLQILGLEFEDIQWMKACEFYKIRNLYYVSSIAISGHMDKEIIKRISKGLCISEGSPTKRIYVSREKALYRKIVNEHELVEELQRYGFEIFYGNELSLSEQITLFSSCSIIVGLHGAGLTNSMFMPPGGRVIELRKKEYGPSNVGYWHLSESLGHQFYYYNGIPDSDLPLVGRGCNLTVPIEDFGSSILEKL